MSKRLVREFEEQFGKEWRCQCKASFKPGNLEVLSESANSLLAHYQCSSCGREQMLAAAISEPEKSEETIEKPEKMIGLPKTTISSDDVLDIKVAVSKMKFGAIKSFGSAKSRKKATIVVSKISSKS